MSVVHKLIECMHDDCERHYAHETVVELETDTEEQREIKGKIIPRKRWNIRIRNKIPSAVVYVGPNGMDVERDRFFMGSRTEW